MRWLVWCGALVVLSCGKSHSRAGAPASHAGGARAGTSGSASGGDAGDSDTAGGNGGVSAGGDSPAAGGRANAGATNGGRGARAGTGGRASSGGQGAAAGAGATSTTLGCDSDGAIPSFCHPRHLDAGLAHTCLLRENGSIRCWGYDVFDLDGYQAVQGMSEPPPADTASDFTWLSIGSSSCAFDDRGRASCWSVFPRFTAPSEPVLDYSSSNEGYQCSLGLDGMPKCPAIDVTAFSQAGPFVQIASSPGFACALTPAGAAHCVQASDVALELVPPSTAFQSIVTGSDHICGLDFSGHAECWGDDSVGEVEPPDDEFTQLSADGRTTCGLTAGGTIECWGALTVAPSGEFVEVAVGSQPNTKGSIDHVCGLREDGLVDCSGGASGSLFQTLPPA
ncbi:MAG TPA: hypothetical protein VGQ57_07285, partial [Polyangiaceae bacterium]|nr:hypothetical protein [Polyangiaceae bacterium]